MIDVNQSSPSYLTWYTVSSGASVLESRTQYGRFRTSLSTTATPNCRTSTTLESATKDVRTGIVARGEESPGCVWTTSGEKVVDHSPNRQHSSWQAFGIMCGSEGRPCPCSPETRSTNRSSGPQRSKAHRWR